MNTKTQIATAAFIAVATSASSTFSDGIGSAKITENGNTVCITSDGLPNHTTGDFPNRGNPHSISRQNISVCVDASPQKNANATQIDRGAIGIAVNGVMIRPEAADYWDPNSRRGFSRTRSDWRVEPMGVPDALGLDVNNAHVDNRGIYHYHGKPEGLLSLINGTLVGYAADGFEIHYVGTAAKPGWSLKTGTRPNGPGGAYDGTYIEDYEFTGGGNLDACNGGTMNGQYTYFVTNTYPFYPRCLWGDVSSDFR
ncbi:MAG: YHYH protein [Pseudomonadota bacterium]